MIRATEGDMRITKTAVEALREAAECFLTNIFEDANLLTLHCKRVTLMKTDLELIIRLKYMDFF